MWNSAENAKIDWESEWAKGYGCETTPVKTVGSERPDPSKPYPDEREERIKNLKAQIVADRKILRGLLSDGGKE
ncbi:MAG: hypothetical protein ACREQ5_39285 [Candidatus Dormibacteria bacterium]